MLKYFIHLKSKLLKNENRLQVSSFHLMFIMIHIKIQIKDSLKMTFQKMEHQNNFSCNFMLTRK